MIESEYLDLALSIAESSQVLVNWEQGDVVLLDVGCSSVALWNHSLIHVLELRSLTLPCAVDRQPHSSCSSLGRQRRCQENLGLHRRKLEYRVRERSPMIIYAVSSSTATCLKVRKVLAEPCTFLIFYPVIPEEVSNRILLYRRLCHRRIPYRMLA